MPLLDSHMAQTKQFHLNLKNILEIQYKYISNAIQMQYICHHVFHMAQTVCRHFVRVACCPWTFCQENACQAQINFEDVFMLDILSGVQMVSLRHFVRTPKMGSKKWS